MRRASFIVLPLGFAFATHLPAPESPTHRADDASDEFPKSARDPMRLEDPKAKMALSISLRGAREVPMKRDGDRAIYAKALADDADLIVTPRAHGLEDSIRFWRQPERERSLYDVEMVGVAGLRLVDNVLEFLDWGGAPRLRIEPPTVVDAHRDERIAKLSVNGCAIDVDPRAPWQRPVVEPRSTRCQVEVSWSELGVVYPATVDPAWTLSGTLSTGHWDHQTVTLPSKHLLVIGGRGGATTEMFDTATETFTVVQPMQAGRSLHRAFVLDGTGDVFVIGGTTDGTTALATTELYNETRGTWLPGPPMSKGRFAMAAAKLPNGKVLVAGGPSLADAEIYDPQTNQWSPAGTMSVARKYSVEAFLPDKTVLVAGGDTGSGSGTTSTAEIYSPPATWTRVGDMGTARQLFSATALVDGRVLVEGGCSTAPGARCFEGTLSGTAELFDPVTKTWSFAGTYGTPRFGLSSVRLLDGKVLVTGGTVDDALGSTALFDPTTDHWVFAGYMNARRWSHTSTLLESGKVLIVGPYIDTTEMYSPQPRATACRADGECATAHCVDGVCCDSPCTGVCIACTAAKKESGADGECGPIAAGVKDPDCPVLDPNTCGATGACDGKGACALVERGAACGPSVCDRDVETSSTCDGRAGCQKVIHECAPYLCANAQTCGKGPCARDEDCSAGFWCDAKGACIAAGCDGDHVIVNREHAKFDCAPYRCDGNGCKGSCRSSTDCASGSVCNTEHRCVGAEEARSNDSASGCFCATTSTRTRSVPWAALLPLVILLLRRRTIRAR